MMIKTDTNDQVVSESIVDLFWTFLKIGSTAFGGFMALISVVQNYMVDRKKLLSDKDMLDGVSLASLLPGAIAVNVAVYAGYKLRGLPGAAVSLVGVVFPSFVLILLLSYAYFEYGGIPAVNNVFRGILPAVAAVVIAAAWNLGKRSVTGIAEGVITSCAMLALVFIGGFVTTITVMILSAVAGYYLFKDKTASENTPQYDYDIKIKTYKRSRKRKSGHHKKRKYTPGKANADAVLPTALLLSSLSGVNGALALKLFYSFSGMSIFLFGGGYVFIPLMQTTVVDVYQWVSQKEFVDGIAMGQITPGPIVITATFIGYKVAGLAGATAATIGVFLPPAILMVIGTHYLDKVQSSRLLASAMKGVHCAIIGMIIAAAYIILLSADKNAITAIILITALIALLKFKLEVAWIVPAAGLIGYGFY